MIQLRTNKEFPIPTKRGVTNGIIYLIIDKIEIDNNNITARGYYYYKDEQGSILILDRINKLQQWEQIKEIEETILTPLESSVNLKSNILQRAKEFTELTLTMEEGENYTTTIEDWEEIL